MTGTEKQKLAIQLLDQFTRFGAQRVDVDILQPADLLLDLYGEDIRGRAYVTHDPLRGELMLRPDFTVPVVQRHMAEHAEPARYCYAGPVFRQQDFDAQRPSEHTQVGYEVFDRGDPELIEAEVFNLFWSNVEHLPLKAVVGDVGLIVAAVDALTTSQARKAALKRHIWRPARFAALLDRFANPILQADPADGGPGIGLRPAADVEDRFDQLRAEAQADPIPTAEVSAVKTLLACHAPLSDAGAALDSICDVLPAFVGAMINFDDRVEAFEDAGIDVETIAFSATYGLTSMEYYDGFVFGMIDPSRPDQPPVASGGRYDALTRALGKGDAVPRRA
ncbi:MAG: ATP phosphoribosyltransferase regulatory subunit [Pseudomonadota bacterium]